MSRPASKQAALVIEMKAAGKNPREIAAATGLSLATVYRIAPAKGPRPTATGIAAPPPPEVLGDEEALRASNNRLLRQLSEARAKSDRLVGAVYQAAHDAASAREPFRVQLIKEKKAGPGDEEVAIVVVSDLQLAKVTPTYNSQVCRERMKILAQKIVSITRIQRSDHPVRELRVWILGDIVEGELIFPGQSFLIDASLYEQVTKSAPDILGEFLHTLLQHFERIVCTCVIGNHGSLGGRARRDYAPESNADRMVYKILERDFRDEPRVKFVIPDGNIGERSWYAVDYIGKRGFLLCHGDQFRWGIKTPSTEQKILGWHSGAIPEPFDEVVCGHWHNLNALSLRGGSLTLRCNGSTESYNTYAQEHIGSMSRPAQWLMFGHPTRGITAEYRVWLDGHEKTTTKRKAA